MKHLINIEQLTKEEIIQIYNRASEFEKGLRKSNHLNAHVVSMFFENSTRTKLSFEMALNKLNAKKYDFEAQHSSIQKGEDLYDTINNLAAIGMNAVILRHSDDTLINKLSTLNYYQDISFINAGSGKSAHPTQALLDFYTLKKFFVDLSGKTITFIGDIAHSRVVKSNIALLKQFDMNIQCLTDEALMGERIPDVKYTDDLKEAFQNTDIIMALRIQRERLEKEIDIENYIKRFQITKDNLPYAAFLMHPGPINRDVEIQSEVLDIQNAKTILNQTKNGVYIRMAILDMILSNKGI